MAKNQDLSVAVTEIAAGVVGLITIIALSKRLKHVTTALRHQEIKSAVYKHALQKSMEVMTGPQLYHMAETVALDFEFDSIVRNL